MEPSATFGGKLGGFNWKWGCNLKVGYYSVFNFDEFDPSGGKYGIAISFPDIPEAISCARTEAEGIEMARDVLQLCTIRKSPEELPEPTPLSQIELLKSEKAIFIEYDTQEVDLSKFTFYE